MDLEIQPPEPYGNTELAAAILAASDADLYFGVVKDIQEAYSHEVDMGRLEDGDTMAVSLIINNRKGADIDFRRRFVTVRVDTIGDYHENEHTRNWLDMMNDRFDAVFVMSERFPYVQDVRGRLARAIARGDYR